MSYYNASITFKQFNKSYKQDCDNKIMAVWPFPIVLIAEVTSHGSRVITCYLIPKGLVIAESVKQLWPSKIKYCWIYLDNWRVDAV
jgi:hypothetical protein